MNKDIWISCIYLNIIWFFIYIVLAVELGHAKNSFKCSIYCIEGLKKYRLEITNNWNAPIYLKYIHVEFNLVKKSPFYNVKSFTQVYWVCFPLTGLRTLCFAVADVSESSYQQWLEILHRAGTSLQNRALKLEESYELIEKVCVASVPDAMASCYVHWTNPGILLFLVLVSIQNTFLIGFSSS